MLTHSKKGEGEEMRKQVKDYTTEELMEVIGDKRREEGLSQAKASELCGFARNSVRDYFKRNGVEWDDEKKEYFRADNTIINTSKKEKVVENKKDVLSDNTKLPQGNKNKAKSNNTKVSITDNTDMATANFFMNLIEGAGPDKVLKFFKNIDYFIQHLEKGTVENDGSISFRNYRSKSTSLRLDEGIYEAIKLRASRDDVSISDIINKACEDYLKNYL